MDQGTILSLKGSILVVYYFHFNFERLIVMTDKENNPTIQEFWKRFNIFDVIKIYNESLK